MQPISAIKVSLDFGDQRQTVGRLASNNGIIYYEYNDQFVHSGIEISPFRLPLKRGLTEFPLRPFSGLAGVFSDSLPDGWGRLLFDRMMRTHNILPANISPLDRLAHVGVHGMGALIYEPDCSPSATPDPIDLDKLATQAVEVMEGSAEEVIEELLTLNGSSAGTRPKALINVDSNLHNISYGTGESNNGLEPWLVKFPNSHDGTDAGAIEYVYALMAKEAGVIMPKVHLFSSQKGSGYFSIKRFDRDGNKRLHTHTASGILHSDFRTPSLDYQELLTLTGALTKDIREVEKMYRLAVFNVLAHNRDDHGKNFSFIMNETGEWKLSPAYDLTFSSGPRGEQSTMVMGEGKNPSIKDLIKLGLDAKLPNQVVIEAIDKTKFALSHWKKLATKFQVSKPNIKLIDRQTQQTSKS